MVNIPETDTIFIAGWCWTVAIGAKRLTVIAAEFGRESCVLYDTIFRALWLPYSSYMCF